MPERKVSLKDIIAAIDKALKELESAPTKTKEFGDERAERARKILKGVRESVEGVCLPNFEVPVG